MRDVLIVTRNFPPASHVSVERAMKLAKYLPEFGWRPTVLTGARATAGLPEDPGLAAQVAGIEVIRARAPEFSLLYGWRASGGAAKAGEIERAGRLSDLWSEANQRIAETGIYNLDRKQHATGLLGRMHELMRG